MSAWTPALVVWLLGTFATLQLHAAEPNLANHKLSGLIQWKYEKRPFCNAFTGCGKKRGSLPPYPLLKRSETGERALVYNGIGNGNANYNNYNNNEDLAEGLSDLIDINAEPAVESVQNQIMSQAKIFEAIREASKEIFRQKNKQKLRREQLREEEEQRQQQQRQDDEERQKMLLGEPGNV